MAEIKLKIASVVIGSSEGGGGGVAPYYADLPDKPSINGETLSGAMTSEDLGLAPSSQSVPTGGTTGQVLAKKSNADNDVQWVNQESGGQGTTDYSDLENKPKINNVTLSGNKTAAQLGLQPELVSGTNIKTINSQSIVGSGNITIEGGGTDDYADLDNKPQINSVALSGNKSASDLGLATASQGAKADTAVQQVTVGTTTTGEAGTNASVTNSGTSTAPVLDFTIPRGADAVNPFKGWFGSSSDLPATGQDGDYAYVKDANASDPAAIWAWNASAATPEWEDTQRTADTSNIQTFKTNEEVNLTPIDNTNLVNPASGALAKAEDAMLLKQQLRGVTLEETKVLSYDYYKRDNTNGYFNTNSSNNYFTKSDTDNYLSCIIELNNCKAVRFLGFVKKGATATTKAYCFLDANGDIIPSTVKAYETIVTSSADSYELVELIEVVPQDAVYFGCIVKDTTVSINESLFYCYLETGETIKEEIDNVTKDVNDLDKQVNGYEGYVYVEEAQLEWTQVAYNRGIDSGNNWEEVSSTQAQFAQITPNSKIKLINTGPHYAVYAILNNVTGYDANTAVSASYATGCTRETLSSGRTVEIDIPSNGNYLYLTTKTSSGSSNTTIYNGTIGHIPGLADEIPEVVDNLETNSSEDALSAKQGVNLNNMINNLTADVFGGEKNVEVVGSLDLSTNKTGTNAHFFKGYYIYSNTTNKSYYYPLSIPEEDVDVYIRIYKGSHNCYATLLASNNGLSSSSTPQLASAMGGEARKKIDSEYLDIKLTNDCSYIVFYNKDENSPGNVDGYYMPSKVEYITKEIVESKIQVQNVISSGEIRAYSCCCTRGVGENGLRFAEEW